MAVVALVAVAAAVAAAAVAAAVVVVVGSWGSYVLFRLEATDEAWMEKEIEVLRRASRAERGGDDDVDGAPARFDAVEVEGGRDPGPCDLIGPHQPEEDQEEAHGLSGRGWGAKGVAQAGSCCCRPFSAERH